MKCITILGLIIAHTICGIAQPTQKLCRNELSVFFAGTTGLGAAWGRAANEPTLMNPGAVADMQSVLGNAREALEMVQCIPFDIQKLNTVSTKLPSLTNAQAAAEIEALIKELQSIIANVKCGNVSLLSLYVTAVHLGAAQAWANSRMCGVAPMPVIIQNVIRNHLNTARDAFAPYLSCVPGVSLSQFDAIPLASPVSIEAHGNIVGLHTNLLWNIALSDCCCECTSNGLISPTAGRCLVAGTWTHTTDEIGSTTWIIDENCNASETGGGNAKGTATIVAGKLTITWTAPSGYAGHYWWILNESNTSGVGELTFTAGGPNKKYKSTVKKQ